MGASLGNNSPTTHTLLVQLDTNTQQPNYSFISLLEVVTSKEPYILLKAKYLQIHYKTIDKRLYRSITISTTCGHTITLQIEEVSPEYLGCNCATGCINNFREEVKYYLSQ